MKQVSLDDKYSKSSGRIYLSGSQALTRLPLMQRQLDLANGLNTAGFISGYRGSPLGVYDLALWKAEDHLKEHHIHFEPGVNEDLAATSIWGTQQVGSLGEAKYDGVFAIWYGKGPGVDRSGDAIKHGNYAGTSQYGGVLALCGDDHGARSSSTAHQSDHALIHFGMPILHPASVQDYIDFGMLAFALSRYSGCWIGFKCVTDTVESSAAIVIDEQRYTARLPTDYTPPEEGLNIQVGTLPVMAEAKLYQHKHKAVHAFVRENNIDRVVYEQPDSAKAKLGIITTGKSYLDVKEALSRLQIDQQQASELGIGLYKVGLVWPIEPRTLTEFATQYDEVLVIEEKRPVMEEQIAKILYNLESSIRPRLVGKRDENDLTLLSAEGELDPDTILQVIAQRLLRFGDNASLCERLKALAPGNQLAAGYGGGQGALMRMPSFCAGCPHNTSTKVPEGSRALGGIGCHGMAVWLPERKTETLYQMGGEGAPWIGQAPFVKDKHIFQNLGDGTYFHSGLLAVRATVAAKVNITYKILLNGAISMTGGQPIEGEQFEGEVTGPHVASQLYAEGVKRIALVTEDLGRHNQKEYPEIVTFHHRDDLDQVQREFREWKGCSVIIYEQACATERRRLRKRGKYPDPDQRLFINQAVCEGCGDCGVQSNCIALEPIETELGRKRKINQSSCNKDFSCVKGMCPSFVTVKGGRLKKKAVGEVAGFDESLADSLPEPQKIYLGKPFSMIVAGIGGNGVVTIGALLGMAAHIENKACSVLDLTGLAQRNGPVTSHVRIADNDDEERAVRIPQYSADLVLGCDLVVASGVEGLSKMSPERTSVVYNTYVVPTSAFASNADLDFNSESMEQSIRSSSIAGNVKSIDATTVAIKVLGDAIGANSLLMGYAWQCGYIPLSLGSLQEAIRLNGTAVDMNLRGFALGRLLAHDPGFINVILDKSMEMNAVQLIDPVEEVERLKNHRKSLLVDYQNEAYADRYDTLLTLVQKREEELFGAPGELSKAVGRYFYKLMAYKDEYEIGRLYSHPEFMKSVNEQFEGDFSLKFNLAPPLISRRDSNTGRLKKIEFGSNILMVFNWLSKLKFLRGTPLDIFGYTAHRRAEREMISEYELVISKILTSINSENYSVAVKIACLPEKIRGYDVVKEESIKKVDQEKEKLILAMKA